MPSLLDIVIPVYGNAHLVEKCLQHLEAQTFKDFKVIMVDDKSPVKTETIKGNVRFVDELYPIYKKASTQGAKVVRNEESRGFPYSVNVGVQKGKSPLILLLNTDVFLEPNALDEMVREMDDSGVGVVGPLLLFPENSIHKGPKGEPLDGLVQHAGMAINIGGKPFHVHLGWSPDNPRVRRNDKIRIVTGACLMTRRSLWNSIGGMALEYGRGTYEDTEYCLRARAADQRVVFTPAARGVHHTGASAIEYKKGFPIRQNYEIFRERCGALLKWDEYLAW